MTFQSIILQALQLALVEAHIAMIEADKEAER